MKAFGKDFYRSLAIGFLVGCAAMTLHGTGLTQHAHAATSQVAVLPQ